MKKNIMSRIVVGVLIVGCSSVAINASESDYKLLVDGVIANNLEIQTLEARVAILEEILLQNIAAINNNKYVVTADTLNIRKEPTFRSPIVMIVEKGHIIDDSVKIVTRNNKEKWLQLKNGFVNMKWIAIAE